MTGGQSAVRMNDRHSFPVGGLVELSRPRGWRCPECVWVSRSHLIRFCR